MTQNDDSINAEKALTEIASKVIDNTLKKYDKNNKIAEEGILNINIVLDVEGNVYPPVEIKANDLHLGYINVQEKKNKFFFKLTNYKRGNGKWDQISITASPIRNAEQFFKKGSIKARYAPVPNSEETITLYIPLKLRRDWRKMWISKKKLPESCEYHKVDETIAPPNEDETLHTENNPSRPPKAAAGNKEKLAKTRKDP